jgi:hypothetical protein
MGREALHELRPDEADEANSFLLRRPSLERKGSEFRFPFVLLRSWSSITAYLEGTSRLAQRLLCVVRRDLREMESRL